MAEVDWLIKQRVRFTADDIAAAVGPPDKSRTPNAKNNTIGSVFSEYSRAGKITIVGHEKSTTPSRKGGLICVWQAV